MASLGLQFGGSRCFDNCQDNLCSPSSNQRPCGAMIRSRAGSRGARVNSLAVARASLEAVPRQRRRGGGQGNSAETAAAAYEKLDAWMRDSVVEIVKNLREAPLLVNVYGKGSTDEKPWIETEKGVEEENWEVLRRKWEGGVAPFPDGVIFVEELMDDDEGEGEGERNGDGEGITRAWGLVVQGKGAECGPACYLLKTSKVKAGSGCGLGMGLGCTHFCLVRVNSFRETAQSQLKNCWLLQAQAQ
ncbi:unnamed protein product [Prunus armeniaca]|uniref:DUF7804 domain-containing protein n=1 Tax=Prunus armeniaca TaxID=36596 RepID=A0A6J5WNH6_PRUAR|nr:unnamed protein product [Prunus armeniaca]